MNRIRCFFVFFSVFLFGAGLHVSAETIVSNLGNNAPDGEAFFANNHWGAQAFITPDYAHTLTAITVELDNFAAGSSQARVELYTNGGNNLPGILIEALGILSFSTQSAQNYTINASGSTVLAANTTYWVVVKYLSGDFN